MFIIEARATITAMTAKGLATFLEPQRYPPEWCWANSKTAEMRHMAAMVRWTSISCSVVRESVPIDIQRITASPQRLREAV